MEYTGILTVTCLHMAEDDVPRMLLQLFDDLLIYDSGSLFDKGEDKLTREDVEGVRGERIVKVLRRYVRPRNEVLKIRRAVNDALENGNVGKDNIYCQYFEAQKKLATLREEKNELEKRLRSIRGKPPDQGEAQKVLMGEMLLHKLERQHRILQIYHKHLKLLHSKVESVDNQTTLVSHPKCPNLVSYKRTFGAIVSVNA